MARGRLVANVKSFFLATVSGLLREFTGFSVDMMSCTKYVWYRGHRDHISCVPKTEELFEEHFYWLKAPGGRLWMSSHAQVTTNLRRTQMPMT